MIHEFAIDPEVIGNFKSFILLRSDLGYMKGRVICPVPGKKSWQKRVIDQARKESPQRQKSICEYITKRKNEFLVNNVRNQDNDPQQNWETVATDMDSQIPFRAIISQNRDGTVNNIINMDDESRENPPYKVRTQKMIRRTAEDIIGVGEVLYRESSEFTIIDPYFRPDENHGIKERFKKTFRQLLKLKKETNTEIKRIDIHTIPDIPENSESFRNFDPKSHIPIWEELESEIPSIIPFWVHYRIAIQGALPHTRHILTEKGGIKYDHGIDTGDGMQDVYLIEEEMHKDLKNIYKSDDISGHVKSIRID